ncbi:hypothetical protein AgCh_020839 [Apium graveolens]
MALKLDMSKAYDRIEWSYLQAILMKMGFDSWWVHLIMQCVQSVSYHIVHAQREIGPIMPNRGLRQGDPLSPYLFILCAKGLSAMLHSFENQKLIQRVKVCKRAPSISHMLFVDDSYFYYKAGESEVQKMVEILTKFELASEQKVNLSKSSVFFSTNTRTDARHQLCSTLQIEEEKMIGGKEVLVKSVIQSLPTYAMKIFLLPLEITKDVERCISKFWWNIKKTASKSIHWMSWDRLTRHKSCGGMGFRDFRDFNLAMLGKQAKHVIAAVMRWKIGSGNSVNIVGQPWLLDENNPFVTSTAQGLQNHKRVLEVCDNEKRAEVASACDGKELWVAPQIEYMKISADATIFSEYNASGLALIARDDHGDLVQA